MSQPSIDQSNEYVDHVVSCDSSSTEYVEQNQKKRKLTSDVWKDFVKKINSEGRTVAVCNHCKKPLGGTSYAGTSHLRNHLKRCARKKTKDVGQQLLSVSNNASGVSIKNFKFDQEKSRHALACAIIKHEYPFNMVEHDYFRYFIGTLQPMFKMVSRNTIRSDIMSIYKEEKEKLYGEFDKMSNRISLTTDLWTSDQVVGYLCLTAHFIDDEWVLRKKIINFVQVESPHSGEVLARVIKDLLLEWNIDKKINTITVDNASSNNVMVEDLKFWLTSQNLLALDGDYFHVRCNAHILNLIVHDGLKQLHDVLHKIRESVKYVRLTPSRKQRFQNARNQVKLQGNRGVSLDVATRWNSTYLMLDSALELKEAFSRLELIDRDYKFNPTNEEWEMGKVIHGCLKIFYDTTTLFSTTKNPTSNLYFPEVCEIHVTLNQWLTSENVIIRSMATTMKLKFDKYWRNCSLILSVASVLDPRFKLGLVHFYYSSIYGRDEIEIHVTKIRNAIVDLYSDYENMNENGTPSIIEEVHASSKVVEKDDKFMRFEQWIMSTNSNLAPQKSEYDQYLDEPLFPRNSDFNILDWWKINSPKFPKLSKIARDILSIPVSTVASESTFSTGGRVLDQYRLAMTPDILQALICTQDFLPPLPKGMHISSFI